MKSTPNHGESAEYAGRAGFAESIGLGRGSQTVRVLSTPAMIMLMELAARQLLSPHLDAAEDSVGLSVDVQHTAPTQLHGEVHAVAVLTGISGRKFDFEVTAYDKSREIGRGRHRRAVVRMEDFRASLPTQKATSMLPESSTLSTSISGSHLAITLNRPATLNAINAVMTSDLEALLAFLEQDNCPVRIVTMTGSGRAFCAGEDVRENSTFSAAESSAMAARRGEICLRLSRLPQPVLALVRGACMGGGLALAVSCDCILATHDALFAMPEIKLGWPPAYAIDRIMARSGPAATARLCLLGETIKASSALELGLADKVLPRDQASEEADRMVRSLLALPTAALGQTKRLLCSLGGASQTESLAACLEAYRACREHPNATEGIQAFLQKREPRFQSS